MFIIRSLVQNRWRCFCLRESVRLMLLTIVVLVLIQCSINCAGAPPKYLLESRANRYFEWYNYVSEYGFNNIKSLPNDMRDMSAWSVSMHNSIVMALKEIVKEVNPLPENVNFSECIVNVNESSRCSGTPKAYLRISTIAECNLLFMLCCPLYWVTDDQPANLPHRLVRPETFFWDGSKAINGFFTNFTEYDTSINCSNLHAAWEDTRWAWKDFRQIGVDSNGAWALLGSYTKSALREIDITDNATAREEANNVFGYDPSQILTKPKQVFASISLSLAIAMNAVILILMTIVMIVVYACCHYPAKKRVEDRKRLFDNPKQVERKLSTPGSDSWNQEVKVKTKAKVNDIDKRTLARNNSNINNIVNKQSVSTYNDSNYDNPHIGVPVKTVISTTITAATFAETGATDIDSNNYKQDQNCTQATCNPLTKPELYVNDNYNTLMFEQPMHYEANNADIVNFTSFEPNNINHDNAYERMNIVDQPFDVYYNNVENAKTNYQMENFDLDNFKKEPEVVGGATDNFNTCANTNDAPYVIEDPNRTEVPRLKRKPSITWQQNQYMNEQKL